MGDPAKYGLLNPNEDPLADDEVIEENGDNSSDSSSEPVASSSDMVELSEVGDIASLDQGNKKKKKKRVVKKRKKSKKGPLPDGVDQAPVNPDELESETENHEAHESQAFQEVDNVETHAAVVTQILVPVCITMAIVVLLVKILNPPESFAGATSLYFERAGDSNAKKFGGALLNALIFVAAMIGITFVFVILYKYRCMKIIFGWLGLSTVVLLGGGFGLIVWQLVQTLNLSLDWLSFAIFVWNFGVVGMLATFWHAPVKINQFYMIVVSVLMAVLFTRLPEWTTWMILAAIAIYDLFAVLCPRGPLRLLVETAQERNENIPALLYNTIITLMATPQNAPVHDGDGDDDEDDDGLHAAPDQHLLDDEDASVAVDLEQPDHLITETTSGENGGEYYELEEPRSGVKLGLGDFIFYSVLVGRAALFDMLTVFTSFIGIITGLFGTILLLAVWRKALPALPLSILFGVIFFFVSRFLLLPFVNTLTMHNVLM